MNIRPLALALALHCPLIAPLQAAITPAPLFQDHAVLQHGKPVPVWGGADAGEKITVGFAGQSVTTTAGPDGRWSVTLKPLQPSAVPAVLTITGKETITFEDILVGEVWLASGQSNMELSLKDTFGAPPVIAATDLPQIREIKVKRAHAEVPLTTFEGTWKEATPANVGSFSAVAFYFARDIHQNLSVPVGIIHSTWGGTLIDVWMNQTSLASDPDFAVLETRWQEIKAGLPAKQAAFDAKVAAWQAEKDAATASGAPFSKPAPKITWGLSTPFQPATIYNAMIHPLAPYGLRGILWYQGESNVGVAKEYHKLFAALIKGWRNAFNQGEIPFYWVQLPNFIDKDANATSWAFLREAQAKTLSLPNTGQAVTIDGTEADNLHPLKKQHIGQRLARLALARTYGKTGLIDSGPVFARVTFDGPKAAIEFLPSPSALQAGEGNFAGIELAGNDRIFHPAEARVAGNVVIAASDSVPAPVAVRYAWRNAPAAPLRNADGLPATPFRSDSW